MEINASYKLPISEQNLPVIGIVAHKLGYDGVTGTPQEYIEKHFRNFFNSIEETTKEGLQEYYGIAGQATVQAIMELYKQQVQIDVTLK